MPWRPQVSHNLQARAFDMSRGLATASTAAGQPSACVEHGNGDAWLTR